MNADAAILERWVAKTISSYPGATLTFLTGQGVPFRNPVGHTVRRSLSTLLEQVRGEMDESRISAALDDIIRIRAVQNLTASQAAGFVLLLKPVLREREAQTDPVIEDRIDRVTLMAFDQYTRCREQLAEIRWNERQRMLYGRHMAEGRSV